MASKKTTQHDNLQDIESALTKTEQFIEDNQKKLIYGIGIIVIIVVSYLAFTRLYLSGNIDLATSSSSDIAKTPTLPLSELSTAGLPSISFISRTLSSLTYNLPVNRCIWSGGKRDSHHQRRKIILPSVFSGD